MSRFFLEQVVKKVKKGKSIELIAEELEEEVQNIKGIYENTVNNGPDYDVEEIFKQLKKGNSVNTHKILNW